MKKLLSILFLVALGMTAPGVHAASHAGAAPMKATAPAAKASEPAKAASAAKKKAAKAAKKETEKK